MKKKGLKRKLIGFIAGEKGSIGKLQGLALGASGLLASGLIAKSAEALEGWSDGYYEWENTGPGEGWYSDNVYGWNDSSWPVDSTVDWDTGWGNWANWVGDSLPEFDWIVDFGWIVDGWIVDGWIVDWSADWPANNLPPSVDVEVQ